jgi:hypothetical protein
LERKSIPIVAAYWASKLSYMKRVIREVLPTDCSPRKTSLNLRRGFEKDVSAIVLCWFERVNFHEIIGV